MFRKFLYTTIITLLIFSIGKLSAQDLLVTLKNDSIDCKLIEFNKFDTITYAYYKGGIKITKKIASNEVEKILTNFYVDKSQVSQDSMELAQVKKSYLQTIKDKSFFKANNYRFSVDLFYAHRIKEVGNFIYMRDYDVSKYAILNDNYGYNIDFCFTINPAKTFFVGVLYNNIKSEADFKYSFLYEPGGVIYSIGPVTRKIEMNTVGIKGMYLLPSKRAFNNLYLQLGFNLTNYKDEYFTTKSYLSFESVAYAPFIGFSYDFRFQKHLAVGFNAMLELGSIQEINSNQNGQLRTYTLPDQGFSILRVTSGIGLKYYFGK